MEHSLKLKCKTIKHLENNIKENLEDLWFEDHFLDTIDKGMIYEWNNNSLKLKLLLHKGQYQGNEKTAVDWEKISAKDIADKELLSKIHN